MNDKQRRGMELLEQILQQAIREEGRKNRELERKLEREFERKKKSIKCSKCLRLLEEDWEDTPERIRLSKEAWEKLWENVKVSEGVYPPQRDFFAESIQAKKNIIVGIGRPRCTPCQKRREEELERHNRIAKYNQGINKIFGGMTQ